VRADPALHRAFTLLDPAELLAPARGHAAFAAALAAFLAEYGHRETASLLLVSAPTWGESPDRRARSGQGPRDRSARPPGRPGPRAEQDLLAHPLVRRAGVGPAVLRLVSAARAGTAFREDTHFHATRPLPVLRRALLETGRRLAAAGVLREADDVLHLRLEELEALDVEPAALAPADAVRLRRLVRARSARRAELAGVPLIAPSVLFPDRAADGDALVTGTPTSGGRATGPVRIVRDAADFGRLRSGDVLVCPYTNPAWTPLFQRAAAVVVDVGGVGSHAAIVAREYGIPAVMGTGTGTAVLVDGQRVTVDGDTGRVVAAAGGSGTLER
jgi:pyruvate,water dikinase